MTIFLQFFSTSWGSTLVNRSFDDDFTVSLFRIYFSFDECFLLKERTNLFEATLTLDDTSAEESETHYFLFFLAYFY